MGVKKYFAYLFPQKRVLRLRTCRTHQNDPQDLRIKLSNPMGIPLSCYPAPGRFSGAPDLRYGHIDTLTKKVTIWEVMRNLSNLSCVPLQTLPNHHSCERDRSYLVSRFLRRGTKFPQKVGCLVTFWFQKTTFCRNFGPPLRNLETRYYLSLTEE